MKKHNKKQIFAGLLLIITIILYAQSPEYEIQQADLMKRIDELKGVISNLQIRCSSGTTFRQESSYVCKKLKKKIAEQKQLTIEWFKNKHAHVNQKIKELQSHCPNLPSIKSEKRKMIRQNPACLQLNLEKITKGHLERELDALTSE